MPPELFEAPPAADIVTVPARKVVAITGRGAPEGEAFQRSIGAAYGVAYTIKFARKRLGRPDFRIGPLEGRWWVDDPTRRLPDVPRAEWNWTLRIAVPPDVAPKEVAEAVESVTTKKGGKLEGSPEARCVALTLLPAARYGRALHVGPYAQEGDTFARIIAQVEQAGLAPGAAHLEVYLNDPRRTKPEKLKTVLLLELAA